MGRLRAWWRERRQGLAELVEEEVVRFVLGALIVGVGVGLTRGFALLEPWLAQVPGLQIADLIVFGLLFFILGGGTLYLLLRPKLSRLRDLAARDDLTGLYNSREFEERLQSEVARAERYGHALSLVLIDLDGFKEINEDWGYETGDLVLKEFAEILRSDIRAADQIFRYRFGDEFAIVAPETDGVGARTMAERLRGKMEDYRFQTADGETSIGVTVSVGVTAMSPGEVTPALQEGAEQALKASKKEGNTVTLGT